MRSKSSNVERRARELPVASARQRWERKERPAQDLSIYKCEYPYETERSKGPMGFPAVYCRSVARYTETMDRRLRAVYKQGVLHPLEPLELDEMQEVTLTLSDKCAVDDDLSGYFTPEEWAAAAVDIVTWDDVRLAFAGVVGSLSDTVIAQRQER